MAKKQTDSPIPALIGRILSLGTAITILIGFGFFGVVLLQAMFSVSYEEEIASTQSSVSETAAPTPALAQVETPPPSETSAEEAVAVAETSVDYVWPTPDVTQDQLASLKDIGQATYINCVACHGPAGKTLVPGMAPNFVGSEYLNGPDERLVMILLNGIHMSGEYTGAMVPWKAILTDEQIAGVLTYIRTSFGNQAPPITEEMVAAGREKYQGRDAQFTRSELEAADGSLLASDS